MADLNNPMSRRTLTAALLLAPLGLAACNQQRPTATGGSATTAGSGSAPATAASGGGGGTKVKIAVGGQPLLVYLPTTLCQQLGYYKEAGLDVSLEDLQGGSKALQALQGGSVDVVSGYYDHTIQMAAKKREIKAFVDMLKVPSIILAVSPKTTKKIETIADLKGANVGVTAPGSSSDFFLKHLLVKAGLKADDAAVQGVGGDASAVAAMEAGKIDACCMLDPAFSLLEKKTGGKGKVKVLSDTRTQAGVKEAFGVDAYPAAVFYADSAWIDKNKDTAKKLAGAMLKTLTFIKDHTAEEIAEKMPKEYAAGDAEIYKTSIAAMKDGYSVDGKITPEGAKAAYEVLKAFIPEVKAAGDIDLTKTYTNEFLG